MNKCRISIRTRILLIMLSFIAVLLLIVLAVFNILVREHIRNSVNEQLRDVMQYIHHEKSADQFVLNIGPMTPGARFELLPDMRRFPRSPVGSAQGIIISYDYDLLYPYPEMAFMQNHDDIYALVTQMEREQSDLQSTEILRVNASGKEYYLISVGIPVAGLSDLAYFLYYVDMTAISSFADRINTVLLAVMGLAGILAVGIAAFLSGIIARPIRELTQFAMRLGHGDFSTSRADYREAELADLAESMNKAAAQLHAYDKEQKTFFQNVSHEFRTPLQAIRSSAEGIEHGILEKNKSSRVIINETDRLGELVEDLLCLSRLDSLSKHDQLTECDLRELLSNCSERQRNTAVQRGLELEFIFDQEPVCFICDEKQMSRAFSNLISNAIRYARSKITISCHQTVSRIYIVVTDDGQGINQEELPHIFDRFFKGKDGKHGIGLSIVKAVVEGHQGKIEAKSTADGTSFKIIFPR